MRTRTQPPAAPVTPSLPGDDGMRDPTASRRTVRRGLAIASGLLMSLLVLLVVQNVRAYRAITAITDAGGIVDSFSGDPLGSYLLPRLLGKPYVLRSSYSVFYGDLAAFAHHCGTGRTLKFSADVMWDSGNAAAAAAARLPHVEELAFAGLSLDDSGLRHLASMGALSQLGLYGSRVSGEGLRHLRALPRLRRLSLTKATLQDEAFVHLAELRALEDLDLRESCFDGDNLARLAKLPQLRALTLDGACIRPQHLRHLRGSQLTYLSLSHTAIDDSAIPHLEALSTLQTVHALGTPLSDKAAAASSHPAVRHIVDHRALERSLARP